MKSRNEISSLVRAAIHQFSNVFCAVKFLRYKVYAITAINNRASVVWKSFLASENESRGRRGTKRRGVSRKNRFQGLIFNF